ncbi:hypothetical protein QU814_14645, partial [Providencia rettgeri]
VTTHFYLGYKRGWGVKRGELNQGVALWVFRGECDWGDKVVSNSSLIIGLKIYRVKEGIKYSE